MTDWSYDAWPSGEPYRWSGLTSDAANAAHRGTHPLDNIDFHVDLGCGTVKKGRIGIDRYPAPGVNIVMDLDRLFVIGVPPAPGEDAVAVLDPECRAFGLPFESDSIKSIISHHCLEHIADGFIALVDEIYRVLEPGGILRVITPLFPSRSAVEDPDHKRYFMEGTWDAFCGHLGDDNNPSGCWLDSFSVPYTKARFEMLHKDTTPALPLEQQWGAADIREIRVGLKAIK